MGVKVWFPNRSWCWLYLLCCHRKHRILRGHPPPPHHHTHIQPGWSHTEYNMELSFLTCVHHVLYQKVNFGYKLVVINCQDLEGGILYWNNLFYSYGSWQWLAREQLYSWLPLFMLYLEVSQHKLLNMSSCSEHWKLSVVPQLATEELILVTQRKWHILKWPIVIWLT